MKSILNLRYLLALAVVMTVLSSCGKDDGGGTDPLEISGCMDPEADNYNASATVDSGNCEYRGCMDAEAENYNPMANIDSGDCFFARDKFIGNYEGSMIFKDLGGLLNQDSLAFTITPGIASANEVLVGVTIQSIPVFLNGNAVGDSILVDDVYNLPDGGAINPLLTGMPVEVLFSGGVGTSDEGATVSGILDIIFRTDAFDDIVDEATLMGERK